MCESIRAPRGATWRHESRSPYSSNRSRLAASECRREDVSRVSDCRSRVGQRRGESTATAGPSPQRANLDSPAGQGADDVRLSRSHGIGGVVPAVVVLVVLRRRPTRLAARCYAAQHVPPLRPLRSDMEPQVGLSVDTTKHSKSAPSDIPILRVVCGFLVAPLLPAIAVYLIGVGLGDAHPLWGAVLIGYVGYGASFCLGAPAYLFLHGRVSSCTSYASAGAAIGAAVGVAFSLVEFLSHLAAGWTAVTAGASVMFANSVRVTGFSALSGALSSAVFWLVAVKKLEGRA